MKRRLLGFALLGAALFFTSTSAYGFGKRSSSCSDCGVAYASPCGTPCGTPCSTVIVSYVEQKVLVTEWKSVKEEHKYWENVKGLKKEKVTAKQAVWKDEPHEYWVNELVSVPEKVKVAEWKPVTREVEVVWYECKPIVTQQKRTVCEWVCVPVTVTCLAAPPCCDSGRHGLFGGLCGKRHNDCAPACAPCPQVVTTTVMQRQAVTREILVDVTTYTRIEHKEKKPVTTQEVFWTEKEVTVQKCVLAKKIGTHKVCTWVDVVQEVDVVVWTKIEKVGVHDVLKPFQVEKIVKVPVYTTVPAAPAPCATPCYSPCSMTTECHSGHTRGGLFRGHGTGCCGK